jgi:hypothetical protein
MMTYAHREVIKINPEAINSGSQNRYLRDNGLPIHLQALMLQMFNRTDWVLRNRGWLQTKPLRVRELSKSLCCSERSVRRYIRDLEARGEIKVHRRFAPSGRQVASIYTMPKLVEFLKNQKGEASAKEMEEPITDQAGELGADNCDTPSKQKSSTKINTYIKFLDITKKDEFLKITGSIKNLPQIRKTIEKARRDVDPDEIYRSFREFIGRANFTLKKYIPHYFRLLAIFAKKYRGPGSYSSEPVKMKPTPKVEPVDIPTETGPVGDAKRALLSSVGDAKYRAWFEKIRFEWSGSDLTLFAPSPFIRRHISEQFSQYLDMLRQICGGSVLVEVEAL